MFILSKLYTQAVLTLSVKTTMKPCIKLQKEAIILFDKSTIFVITVETIDNFFFQVISLTYIYKLHTLQLITNFFIINIHIYTIRER